MKLFPLITYRYLETNTLVEIRSGQNRLKFTPIWVVNVNGRIFARSWNKNDKGWMHDFLSNGFGDLKFGEHVIQIKALKLAYDDLLNDQISEAYLHKYTEPHNLSYAQEIAKSSYYNYTVEFIPM